MSTPVNLADYAKQLATMQKLRRKSFRSTLTLQSALPLKPFFDAAISTVEPILIPYSAFPRCTQRTVYVKVTDALLWFCEHDSTISDAERKNFYLLKATFKIEVTVDGILLNPRKIPTHISSTVGQIAMREQQKIHTATSVIWKEDMIEWMNTAPQGAIFKRTGLALSSDDVAWVKACMADLGWPCKISIDTVQIVKDT